MNYELIKQYNGLILKQLSEYLNNCPDFITADMISETMRDCGLSEEDAFKTLLAGALGIYEKRDIRSFYLPGMCHRLDTETYRNNPYYKKINIENAREGGWSTGTKRFAPFEAFVCDDLLKKTDGRIIPQIGYFNTEYIYPCIFQDGREWMTITPNEIETMKAPIDAAFGDVATYGLGLGYFAFMCSEKENVASVTIVERDESVISLFKNKILPQFPHGDKIKIVCNDALFYSWEVHKHDFVFADIWHDVYDGLGLYLRLKKLEKPGTVYSYWIENTMKCYL